MTIGKGLVKFDDYNKFGSMLDCMAGKGAVNFSYSPKKGVLVVMVRKKDAEAVKHCVDGYEIVGEKEWHGMVWIKIKI